MNRQQIKQAARRKVLEAQEERRRERAAQDKRLEGLAVDVLVALAERDEAIREAEQRAGVAVLSMQQERLSASQVAQWCGARVRCAVLRNVPRTTVNRLSAAGSGPSQTPDDEQSAAGQEQRVGLAWPGRAWTVSSPWQRALGTRPSWVAIRPRDRY